MTYAQIMELLEARHSKDLFVPECKDGQSWGRTHHRLDAWAMRRSYSQWQLSGYEIKMSRSDFLNDDKYPAYLLCCNVLYFVAPHGIIDPKELPEEVGLLVVAKTGSRVYTKKKAPIRTIDPPVSLYEYVLMSRAKIENEDSHDHDADLWQLTTWREYLDGKRELQDLGHVLSAQLAADVRTLRRERDEAVAKSKTYDAIENRIREMGFDPDIVFGEWQIAEVFERAGVIPPAAGIRQMRRLIESVGTVLDKMEPQTIAAADEGA